MAVPGDHSNLALHNPSPLDTLVRQTSARRPTRHPSPTSGFTHQAAEDRRHYVPNDLPPRTLFQQPGPASPLLHSQFSRSSSSYSNDAQSYVDPRSSLSSRNTFQDIRDRFRDDDESLHPPYTTAPALRDSWHSTSSRGTLQPIDAVGPATDRGSPYQPPSPLSQSPIPTLVVSSATSDSSKATSAGRTPITRPVTSNFSRPARMTDLDASAVKSEAKRRVIERNTGRSPSPAGQQLYYSNSVEGEPRSLSPPGRTLSPPLAASPASLNAPPTGANQSFLDLKAAPEDIILPRRPPSLHPDSPVSVYSTYSYYQYDSAAPSPAGASFQPGISSPSVNQNPNYQQAHSLQAPDSPLTEINARTPQEFLQLGIQHHEANRLKESATCFEKSAKENGGCGVGMLMWGLALRHGWGCQKNEKSGFNWLRKAAESAVEDLESARGVGGIDTKAVQTELILAIYEVGQCFFQGWGVPKDQKMAVSYYMVAARLGDPDAQSDLAFCLANGKGCKKDRKEAAKWYRAAVAQGQSDVGLAWIYKDKYQ